MALCLATLVSCAANQVPGSEDSATGSPTASPSAIAAPNSTIPPEVMATIQQQTASELGVPADALTLASANERQWSDACLGVAQANEMCAQMITPGYEITFDSPDGRVVVHTDRSGRSLRIADKP
ncbi:hypothetical protein ACQ4M4_21350 [Leptolyngbya sp. AN02str]|uniref:hypothetical protein n=1 Tax=Leptolyngbya sp. AN02str TaxID=3423363 RepID=UPI003D320A73